MGLEQKGGCSVAANGGKCSGRTRRSVKGADMGSLQRSLATDGPWFVLQKPGSSTHWVFSPWSGVVPVLQQQQYSYPGPPACTISGKYTYFVVRYRPLRGSGRAAGLPGRCTIIFRQQIAFIVGPHVLLTNHRCYSFSERKGFLNFLGFAWLYLIK